MGVPFSNYHRNSLWPGTGPALTTAEHRGGAVVETKGSVSTVKSSTSPAGSCGKGLAGILSSGLTLDLREQTGLGLRGRCRALVCPAGAWECREGDTSVGKAGKLWWGEVSEEAPCYGGALCPGAHPPTWTPPCCVGKRTPKTTPQT